MRLAKVNKPTKWFTMNYVLLAQYVVFNHTWKWPGWSSTVLILESDNVEKRKNTLWPGAFNDIWKILRTSGNTHFIWCFHIVGFFLKTPKNVRHSHINVEARIGVPKSPLLKLVWEWPPDPRGPGLMIFENIPWFGPEIGTLGTPGRPHGTNFFFFKIFLTQR